MTKVFVKEINVYALNYSPNKIHYYNKSYFKNRKFGNKFSLKD